jgi:hypothetical protein
MQVGGISVRSGTDLKLYFIFQMIHYHTGLHSLPVTKALDHEAEVGKAQQMVGHANISTTRLYDQRKSRPGNDLTVCMQFRFYNWSFVNGAKTRT